MSAGFVRECFVLSHTRRKDRSRCNLVQSIINLQVMITFSKSYQRRSRQIRHLWSHSYRIVVVVVVWSTIPLVDLFFYDYFNLLKHCTHIISSKTIIITTTTTMGNGYDSRAVATIIIIITTTIKTQQKNTTTTTTKNKS